MFARTVKTKSIDEFILPLPGVYSKGESPHELRGIRYFKALASGAVLAGISHNVLGEMTVVYCPEHDRSELIPVANLKNDLHYWYDIGRHPKFSIVGALLEAKQRFDEIQIILEDTSEGKRVIPLILRKAQTKEEFLEAIRPRLGTFLHVRGRRHRVTNEFKDRYKRREFTVMDFFEMNNQEIRRIMLRALPIQQIISEMKEVARDEEGTIYEMKETRGFGDPRYLYVKCPSTGQEYLLGIPRDIESPKEARRWTFGLPADTEFAKEA